MSENGSIEHIGRVDAVEGRSVFVRITSQSACGACKARSACGMSEAAEKIVEVETSSAEHFEVGDEVVVSVRRRIGLFAVAAAYFTPFAVMLGILVGAETAGLGDGWAAGLALAGVAVYYFVLWFFRRRISDSVNFVIHKI